MQQQPPVSPPRREHEVAQVVGLLLGHQVEVAVEELDALEQHLRVLRVEDEPHALEEEGKVDRLS